MGTRKNTDMFNTTDLNLVPYSIKKFGLFTSSLITSPDSVAIKRGLDYHIQFTLGMLGWICHRYSGSPN